MHAFLIARLRPLSAVAFWVSELLVLPNCSFDPPEAAPANLSKGATPHNDLIMCDIEKLVMHPCSSAAERARGIRLSEAAIALVEGRTSDVALDDSESARADCGGEPKAVYFQGPFPQGFAICLNCGDAIGTASQPDVTTACQKQCYDFFGTIDSEGNIDPDIPPDCSRSATTASSTSSRAGRSSPRRVAA
jgi:hypothetical protein